MSKDGIQYVDDDKEPVELILRLRLPSLFIGLVLGIVLTFAVSRFEEVLQKDVYVSFFIPFIVYLAAAVGSQTQNIYARDLRSGKAHFHKYLVKESILGVLLGAIFSAVIYLVVWVWFASAPLAKVVSLSTLGAVATAPLVALLVTEIFQLEHEDPAAGAGPVATVIQDTISIVIYGLIASAILL